jgi:hypothetical protein
MRAYTRAAHGSSPLLIASVNQQRQATVQFQVQFLVEILGVGLGRTFAYRERFGNRLLVKALPTINPSRLS